MRIAGFFVLLLLATAALVGQAPPNPVPWAYGYVTPGPEPLPPPCPSDARPNTCSRPGRPWIEDGILLELPGSARKFAIAAYLASL